MPNTKRALVLPAVLALLAGCGPKRTAPIPATLLTFSNESVEKAAVYAVRPTGSTMRLGTVEAGHTAELKVPPTAIGADGSVAFTVRIQARPRLAPTTGALQLHEGERIALRLPPDLRVLTVVPNSR